MQNLANETTDVPDLRNYVTSRLYWMGLAVVSALSLWLRSGFPLTAMPVYKHDDQLFLRLAHFLATGHWLGPYDNLTLAKGPFYSMFIAAAFWAAVPLKIAEQLFYLLVCLLAALVARRFAGSRLSLILFTVLAFNPVMWNYALERVIRQGVYLSVALAVVTLVVVICFPPLDPARRHLENGLLGVGLGLFGTAYWLTREEGIWLVPSIAIILAVAVLGMFRSGWSLLPEEDNPLNRSARLKALAIPLVIAAITFTAADFWVAWMNCKYYGIFETAEFRSKNFVRAYGALSRIQPDHYRYLMAFPADVRQRAYGVSPAARELAPWLEGSTRELWIRVTCAALPNNPCDEVQTGVAMWELRDAVASAGHAKSGADAMRFYGQLADEIDAACDAKKISCLPARATMQPPFRPEYVKIAWQHAKAMTPLVFRLVEGPVVAAPSLGPDEEIALFADTIDDVYEPERTTVVLRGWVAAAATPPVLRVENRSGDPATTTVAPALAPDVEKVYPQLKSWRFELRTNCPLAACDLVIDVPGVAVKKFPLSSVARPGPIPPTGQTASLMGYVDVVTGTDAFALRHHRRGLQAKIANRIASIYFHWAPRLVCFAIVGLLLATFFRRWFPLPTPVLAFGLASATAVAVYIALMSYVKATADMNVITVLYLSPSSPFVITFTVLGLYAFVDAFKHCRDGVRKKRSAALKPLQHIALI